MERDALRILLLQIREDETTIIEELNGFSQTSGLSADQFGLLNVFTTPDFEPNIVDNYDALFIGGSSDASVLEESYVFHKSCRALIRYCYDNDVPTLASCYGFQLAVEELGGHVIVDKPNMEIGVLPVYLTDQASEDELFAEIPSPFWAVSGHKERAESLGDEMISLAYSDLCPFHAFRIKDKPFYATQFHPEMSAADLRTRIERYRDRYLEAGDDLETILGSAANSTEFANKLVSDFVTRILMKP